MNFAEFRVIPFPMCQMLQFNITSAETRDSITGVGEVLSLKGYK